MADPYIDLSETVIYGAIFCAEARAHVLPLGARWAGAVEACIALQTDADRAMLPFLERAIGRADPVKVAEAGDTIVRFGNWIASLKGRPIDAAAVFRGAAPSAVARRRLPKMVGAIERMITHLTPYAESGSVDGAVAWLVELQAAHAIAVHERGAQRAGRAEEVKLAPDAEQARGDWLTTYGANKNVVEGILRHERKEHLMTLVFDDLAEHQRPRSEPGTDPAAPGT